MTLSTLSATIFCVRESLAFSRFHNVTEVAEHYRLIAKLFEVGWGSTHDKEGNTLIV